MAGYLIVVSPRGEDINRSIFANIYDSLQRSGDEAPQKIMHSPNTAIYLMECRGTKLPYEILPYDKGIILGRAFPSLSHLSAGSNDYGPNMSASHLCEHYWGQFISVIRDENTLSVYREPSGAIPCCFARMDGVYLFSDNPATLSLATGQALRPNLEYLAKSLHIALPQQFHSAIHEIDELLPGQLVRLGDDGIKKSFLWNPYDLYDPATNIDIESATKLLRDALDLVAGHLSNHFRTMLLHLGGLDSSILLSQIAKFSCEKPRGLHFYSGSSAGDERYFAEKSADFCNVHLKTERLVSSMVHLDSLSDLKPRLQPPSFLDLSDFSAVYEGTDIDYDGSNCRVFAVGGDNVFCQTPTNYGAHDFRFSNSKGFTMMKALMASSRNGKESLLNTFLTAYTTPRRRNRDLIYRNVFSSLTEPSLIRHHDFTHEDLLTQLHPQIVPPAEFPIAKGLQIMTSAFFSLDRYNYIDRRDRLERIFPMLTQPVVEACITIPFWIMNHSGADRSLARTAFADSLHPDVYNRVSKGTPSDFYEKVFRENIDFIRSFLLDGVQVKEGVISGAALEKALSLDDPLAKLYPVAIFRHVGLEAWIASLRNC